MIPYWHEENMAAIARAIGKPDRALSVACAEALQRNILTASGVPDITPEDPAGEVQELQIRILETSGVPGLAESYQRHIARPETAPEPLDWLAEYRQVMAEPLGLGWEQLPAYGVPEPGCCCACLRGPLYIPVRPGPLRTPSLCIYCHALLQVAPGPGSNTTGTRTRTARYRRTARTQVFPDFCAVACFILAVLMIVQAVIK